jgi:hypothetical protein
MGKANFTSVDEYIPPQPETALWTHERLTFHLPQ